MSKRSGSTRFNTKPSATPGIVVLIGKGVLVSLFISLLCTLFLSMMSLLTENTYIDSYMQYIVVGVNMLSIFIGSVYATQQAAGKGLLIGMCVGIIYVLLSAGVGMEMIQEYISLSILANKFVAGVAAGILGGLVGVNL